MKTLFCLIVFLFSTMWSFTTLADHMYGGNLSLTQIDKNAGKFNITLNVYSEVDGGKSSYRTFMQTEQMSIRIFSKSSNAMIQEIPLNYNTTTNFIYANQRCATLRNFATANFVFTNEVILNPDNYTESTGYYMSWTRCCRNNAIINIVQAGSAGSTFYLEFPALKKNGVKVSYSSPKFNTPNGDYACKGKPFKMPIFANNPELTDELRYSIVTPYASINSPSGYKNIVEKKPYPLVQWNSGFSLSNNVPGNPKLSVDSQAGIVSITPSMVGTFAFTIQCEQIRSGVVIGLVLQDLQLTVVDCYTESFYPSPSNKTPVTEIKICPGESIDLNSEITSGNFHYQWQKEGYNIEGANQATFQATQLGNYNVVILVRNWIANKRRENSESSVKITRLCIV
jgi:hypothetical protein